MTKIAAMESEGLEGRVAVVTGAHGLLGPVWSSTLRDAGMTVVGLDVREGDGVREADVRDRDALRAVLETLDEAPSVLVNNAGIDFVPGPGAGGQDEGPFRDTIDVNVTGLFNTTEVFGSAMRDAGRGSIVNIGSLYAGAAPDPSMYEHLALDPPFLKPPAYGASKAGVVSLTRYFARLWGPHGVRVNALSPGGVLGEQDPEFLRKFTARTPLRRLAESGDLTGPLLFLASDASRYVTGQELLVDGGFTA